MNKPVSSGVWEDVKLKTTCYGCPAGTCGMLAHRVNGIVVDVQGDPDCPFSQGHLCAKGHAQIMMAYSKRRVTTPLKRTNPEKGIGIDPRFVEIGYDEAIALACEKLSACKDDPAGLFYVASDFPTFPWFFGALLGAFGCPNFDGGSYCGNSVHATLQQVHGGFHACPDFHHSNYVLLIGSNKGAMGNWAAVTATLEMSRARSRGMKLVVVDPVCSNAASIADEWVPIRPGTDGALVLAMINVLINELNLYDVEFLRKLSNGPYLVNNSDGRYVRDGATNKPLMWDTQDQKAKCYDDPTLSLAAMEGVFEIEGQSCTTAFQLLKRHLTDYTPERVEEITTVPAATIRRLAKDFGTAASIGKTIEIEGVTLPLRPACAHWYKGISQHAQGFEQGHAIAMLNTVVGAIDVPGGLLADTVYAHHPEYHQNCAWMGNGSGLRQADGIVVPGKFGTYNDNYAPPFPPKEVKAPAGMTANELMAADLFMGGAMAKINVLNPKEFNNKIPHNPKVLVQGVGNNLANEGNPKFAAEYLKKYSFQISIVPTIDETAEFADLIIPTQTQLERLDMGGNNIPDTMGSTATYENCINLRQPVVETHYKHFVDVWIDMLEGIGLLPKFNLMVNHFMELRGQFEVRPDRKYSHRELTECWIGAMTGGQLTLADVAKEGRLRWSKTVKERFPRPYFDARIPIYYEYHIDAGERVKAMADSLGMKWDVSRYKALTGWYPGPAHSDRTEGFELYGVSYKQSFKTGTFSNFNAWLGELGEYQERAGKIILNRKYAHSKGIKNGDRVRVENIRGSSVEGIVLLSECIHPECVGMDHNGGNWAKSLPPRKRGLGVHYGTLVEYEVKNLDFMDGAIEASPKLKVSSLEV